MDRSLSRRAKIMLSQARPIRFQNDVLGRRAPGYAGLRSKFRRRLLSSKLWHERRRYPVDIKRNGSQPSGKGPAEYFTGMVRIDPLLSPPEPARVSMALVTFEPGGRTAWHTHPLGQTLIVTSGCGWVQRDGGPIEEVRAGDVVWFAPRERHWHGATPSTAMTHIAVQERLDGSAVDWMEKVTEEQYRRATPGEAGPAPF